MFSKQSPAVRHGGRAASVALVFALGLGLAACTGGGEIDTGFTEPAPVPSAGSADVSSPFIVAAAAVSTRSHAPVVLLHGLGVSTTHDRGIPAELIAPQAEKIVLELQGLLKDATMQTPPTGTPAAQLVAALWEYEALATELSRWAPDAEPVEAEVSDAEPDNDTPREIDESPGPLPEDWFDRLRAADDEWLAAQEALSELTGDDLLANLAPLSYPEG